jgi:hypothetical protein
LKKAIEAKEKSLDYQDAGELAQLALLCEGKNENKIMMG